MRHGLRILAAAAIALSCAGCPTTQQHLLDSNVDQLRIRSIQTRVFDTTDRKAVLVATISTLQDLGYVVDKADADLGTVTATKLSGYSSRVTATVRPRGEKQVAVRASIEYNDNTVDDPQTYQDFFVALGKSLFLSAHQMD
ncbi:MAG TPA: hypothetical protein VMT58_02160 [Candidatus Binataceae bacterium]|nr:hypothetical protein [Candidatus Binataceae bacterium]